MNLIDAAYLLSIGPHYLWHRWLTGKYGPKTAEKTGDVPDRFKSAVTRVINRGDPHYENPCLWLHAVSVGEVRSAKDLVRGFMADNPLWEVRVSTTTATGRKVAVDLFGEECVFYYPLDFSWAVERAFVRIRPSLVVLMELEIWPNFLRIAGERSVPVAVANARITERSVKRLGRVPSLARDMAEAVEEWYAQTDLYAQRLRSIGVPESRISVLGSIKYDAVPDEIDDWTGRRYRRLFGCPANNGKSLIVAGSTHPGEDEAVLDAWKKASADGRRPRLVLVPRHPERLDRVEALAKTYGETIRRSALPEPDPDGDAPNFFDADIVVGDTMGELAKMYAAADLVFVGGTLTTRGGQNFIEPCGLGKATIVGPNLWNFQEPADLLAANHCLRVVRNAAELAGAFDQYLDHPDQAAHMGERARALLLNERGATERIVERLGKLAGKILRRRHSRDYDEDY